MLERISIYDLVMHGRHLQSLSHVPAIAGINV
jgi:hypothetical protein